MMIAMLASAMVHFAASQIGWRVESAGNRDGAARSGDPWAALEVLNVKTFEDPAVGDPPAGDPTDVAAPARTVTEVFRGPVGSVGPPPDPGPPVDPGTPSAATRLRTSGPDPRLFGVPVEEGLADFLPRPPEVRGRDSLRFTTWGEDASGIRLEPGVLTIGGVSVPFCGGPDADRCGFGVRPWDLERADHEAEFRRGLEEQGRWESIQERAREIRRRAHARRDTTPRL